MLVSEVMVGQGQDLRGFSWWGDAATFETFLTPNSSFPDVIFSPYYCINQSPNPPCTGATTALPDNYAARSRHSGGVNVAMGDGSVRFIKNSINVRTWRAMSTTRGNEVWNPARIDRRENHAQIPILHSHSSRRISLGSFHRSNGPMADLLPPPDSSRTGTEPFPAIDRLSRDPASSPMGGHAAKLAGPPVRALAGLPAGAPPAHSAATGAGPVRRDGLRRVGAFTMTGVRPVGLPPVWGLSSFHETNLRTYVRLADRDPGVWFFNLEAANSIAVRLARALFHLPYHRARMFLERERVPYENDRNTDNHRLRRRAALARTAARLVRHPGDAHGIARTGAEPGTLDHFLVERYILYSVSRDRLFQGRVHHTPYPLQSATLHSLDETLLATWNLQTTRYAAISPFLHGR